jgi:hypothetical protein
MTGMPGAIRTRCRRRRAGGRGLGRAEGRLGPRHHRMTNRAGRPREVPGLDELDRTGGERFDRLHRLAVRVADADVVEPDDVPVGAQRAEELGSHQSMVPRKWCSSTSGTPLPRVRDGVGESALRRHRRRGCRFRWRKCRWSSVVLLRQVVGVGGCGDAAPERMSVGGDRHQPRRNASGGTNCCGTGRCRRGRRRGR